MNNHRTLRPWRRRALAALLAAGLAVPLIVFSVNDADIFEIEGDAIDGSAVGDDWENIADDRPGGPNLIAQNNSIAMTFITDGIGAEDTSFTGGGSKDVRDISLWQHTIGQVSPIKNEIGHAFAAAYIDPFNDHLHVYFGLDRSGSGGDAATGFWFFKEKISLDAAGSFSGVHTVGDVLVTSDYVTGGKIGEINVYTWVGGQKPLQLVGSSSQGGGNTSGERFYLNNVAGQTKPMACAASNSSATDVPSSWSQYLYREGGSFEPRIQFPERTFFEGGVDITQIFGEGSSTCFASFMAMTRTSASTSAQLKDFALGDFGLCDMAVAKSCVVESGVSPVVGADGTSIDTKFRVRISNPGAGPIHDVQLVETALLGGTSGNSCKLTSVDIVSGAGTAAVPALVIPAGGLALATGAAHEVAQSIASKKYIDAIVVCNSLSNPFLNKVQTRAKTSSSQAEPDLIRSFEITKGSGNECAANISAALSVSKDCVDDGVTLVNSTGGMKARACFSIEISNTSAVTLNELTVEDLKLSTSPLVLPRTTLGPQGSATATLLLGDTNDNGVIDSGEGLCFDAAGPDGGETNPGLAVFGNTVVVTALPALLNPDVPAEDQLEVETASDECPLCPCVDCAGSG